ncbi:hypothetical protein ZIOFF_058509 [Zingiber officinale]|uniref:Adenosylhomocysteinase n=1 Tax=Zingiber officinale TaxID=94328 RepID=A0A8J5F6E5_ZINOF|nr:hypothetical protein ZIOFF_058509 [Zingiber officinale]
MESYLQGQDLWEFVGGNEVMQLAEDANDILRKWRIKAGQEAITKQMGEVSLKGEEEALYTNKSKGSFKRHAGDGSKKDGDKSNTATSNPKENSEDDWDAEALFAAEENEVAFTTMYSDKINYKNDWIIDSGCSNHMTGDKEKLQNLSEYKGARMVVTTNNSRLPIAHIGHYVLFDPEDVKFDKKAIRYIFVGYDSQRKGWKCCDPTSGRCYTSRNVVFDEASSWWNPVKEVLSDSKDLEDKLQQKMGEHIVQLEPSSDESGNPNDNDIEQGVAQSPWQTEIYQQPIEEERPSEMEESTPQSQLRSCNNGFDRGEDVVGREYKVKELSQADFVRLGIELAEVEMPGLMACRGHHRPRFRRGLCLEGRDSVRVVVVHRAMPRLGCRRRPLTPSSTTAATLHSSSMRASRPKRSGVGKGCFAALKQTGARVIVTGIDPVLTLEGVLSEADIFVTTIGNKGIIMVDHMKLKNNAIVCTIGHFDVKMFPTNYTYCMQSLEHSKLETTQDFNPKRS